MLRSELILTYVAIVDAGSLNAAAGKLGVSRSVISDRLKALESDLGVQLVTRSTHGLSLTQSGKLFLGHARDLLEAMEKARDVVADEDGALSGSLRVAVPVSLGVDWLTPIFTRFLEAHPRMNLEISASDQTVDIIQEGFDVAIRGARHSDSDLLARRLTTGRRLVVCSPAYADRHGVPGSFEDLRDHSAIIYRNRRISQDWTFLTEDGRRAPRLSGRFETDSGIMMRVAAVEGFGLALLPTFMISADLLAGRLQVVDLGLKPETDSISAVYPRAHRTNPRLSAFVDHLRVMLGDPPPWDIPLIEAGFIQPD
ncbi:LysR family transcriptional regulator [Roseibium aggregatum]|uniref:LysR family transcriptional regulator n=1 Tax=Roseibium aggregatum TaxID=187304 RepID=A0A926SAH9_9HYPH|nr:LysR family transcriptional regulator [Roseibium aggregatum]MBD1549204.1 LysR family transcriptional regulator [Roseibium aggregatum]